MEIATAGLKQTASKRLLITISFACMCFPLPSKAAVSPICTGPSVPPIQTITVGAPDLNSPTEVEVGQVMMSDSRINLYPAAVVVPDAVDFVGTYDGLPLKLHIPAGPIPLESASSAEAYFVSSTATAAFGKDLKVKSGTKAGISFATHDPNKPKVFWYRPSSFLSSGVVQEYELTDKSFTYSTCARATLDSVRRELVYSGVSQGTVTLLYRESMNDLARPAFSQELHYDLKDGGEIGYKGARFRIFEAGNTGIKYEVLKPLD